MNTRTTAPALLAPFMIFATGACDGGTPSGIVLDDGGDGDFTIEISEDDPPVYDWPAPGGLRIVVERESDATVIWRVVASDPDVGFTPPVTHGVSPVGGVEEVDLASQLVAGEEFRIRLTRIDGSSSSRTFAP